MSSAGCAVAIAPRGYAEQSREIKTIGVAYNDTPESEAALAAARSLAARLRASVRALTVVSLAAAGPGAWGALGVGWGGAIEQAARDRLRSLDGVDGRVAFGPPGEEPIAFGDDVDLLVVGSRSFGPLRRLILGSTSMHLARDVRSLCSCGLAPPWSATRGMRAEPPAVRQSRDRLELARDGSMRTRRTPSPSSATNLAEVGCSLSPRQHQSAPAGADAGFHPCSLTCSRDIVQSMTSPVRHSSFRPDVGLQARMVLTMLLLGLLYVAFVAVLFSAGASVVTMTLVVCGLAFAQLLLSDKLALRAMGARVVSVQDAPELHALVERLCVQADMPKPRLALADTSTPNAFAIGRSPKNAVVCATTGLLDVLEPAELEGVLAHELSHIQNRDVLVMTLASFFATVASLIAQVGLFASPGGRTATDSRRCS